MTARMIRCHMRKIYGWMSLAVIAACHTKDNLPTTKPEDNPRLDCAAIRAPLQAAYRSTSTGPAEAGNVVVVADNVAMMMQECEQAPARVMACVQAHALPEEITQLCTAPIDDSGSEGHARFGGPP